MVTIGSRKYVPLSMGVLVPGMNINHSVYYQKNGMYVLLCKDVVLNEELIDKLKDIAIREKNIYVPQDKRDAMIEESRLFRKVEIEVFEGYDEIKGESKELFNNIAQTDTVCRETTAEILNTIDDKLEKVDHSVIIQSINQIREVDEYLHTHSVNVSLLNGMIGKWKKLDEESVSDLIEVGLYHDIGKIRISPEILNKPAKLTDEEFAEIKRHSTYSYEMLDKSLSEVSERVKEGVLQHHEKVNGSGYPNRLVGDAICEFARITAVSDVYDAMVARRTYKEAHSPFTILAWFSDGRFSELDIEYVNLFLECMVSELRGKNVLMSDGSIAEVIYVNPQNYEYPIVKIGDTVMTTSSDLYVVRMYTEQG